MEEALEQTTQTTTSRSHLKDLVLTLVTREKLHLVHHKLYTFHKAFSHLIQVHYQVTFMFYLQFFQLILRIIDDFLLNIIIME